MERLPPRPTKYPVEPAGPGPSKVTAFVFARLIPGVVIGMILAGVCIINPFYASPLGSFVVRLLARGAVRGASPAEAFWLWLWIGLGFGIVIACVPRQRDGWGRVVRTPWDWWR